VSLVPLGSLSIAAAVPAAADVNAALLIATGIAAPNVSAQITAVGSFTPTLSPGLDQLLALANAILSNIQAAIAAIPPIPILDLQAQIDLAASVQADLLAMLVLINVQVELQLEIAALLVTGGIAAYAWDGANNALGPALTTELGGSTAHSNAIILYTTSPSAWVAMQAFFKTTP
jgi:hypothetical protein